MPRRASEKKAFHLPFALHKVDPASEQGRAVWADAMDELAERIGAGRLNAENLDEETQALLPTPFEAKPLAFGADVFSSWNANISMTAGQYVIVADSVLFAFVTFAFSGAPEAVDLEVVIRPAGWKYSLAGRRLEGDIFDLSVGNWRGPIRGIWEANSTLAAQGLGAGYRLYYGSTSNTLAAVTRTAPITIASGDVLFYQLIGQPVTRV